MTSYNLCLRFEPEEIQLKTLSNLVLFVKSFQRTKLVDSCQYRYWNPPNYLGARCRIPHDEGDS